MKKIIILLTALLGAGSLKAQVQTPVKWAYAAKKEPGGLTIVFFRATIDEGWHIYSVNQKPGGPQKTAFIFSRSPDYTPVGRPTEPKPESRFEDAFGIRVYYFNSGVTFQQKIKLKKNVATIKGKLTYMACTDKQCLPPDEVNFEIPVK